MARNAPFRIEAIAVPAQAEVFHCVEAGYRRDGVIGPRVEGGGVAANELQSRHVRRERPNVNDSDRHEDEQVGDEAVDARTDVEMLLRAGREDPPRGPQVLVKVVAPRHTRAGVVIRQHGMKELERRSDARGA